MLSNPSATSSTSSLVKQLTCPSTQRNLRYQPGKQYHLLSQMILLGYGPQTFPFWIKNQTKSLPQPQPPHARPAIMTATACTALESRQLGDGLPADPHSTAHQCATRRTIQSHLIP